MSCKGGVGKSTIATNMAVNLSERYKKKIGLFDADIYGPNHKNIFNTDYKIKDINVPYIEPLKIYGLQSMSISYFLNDYSSVLLRGPMASNTIKHLFEKTAWENIEYFIIDFPPGTGDIYLSLLRDINFNGIYIITTPSSLSVDDIKRSISMLQKFNIDIYGLIENMKYYVCKNCKKKNYIFGNNNEITTIIEKFKIKKHYVLEIDTEINESENKIFMSSIKDTTNYSIIDKISVDLLNTI